MSKYKIKVRCTGADFEEKISLFGFRVVRKGSMMEMEVEAPDEESAKDVIRGAIGAGNNLLLDAQKL
ncbi:hypothetical protein NDA01_13880 [Trichocoleus desertorum AS-A10]|uniref:hypothetical protein n=1 Tax=Trichocoleus desertorum TaxID=1481672 RepID=UPI003296E5B6